MSKKNSITTCDYINFIDATEKGKELMRREKTEMLGLYIIVAINTGLRVSDLLQLKYEDLRKQSHVIRERKTNKAKEFKINTSIQLAIHRIDRNAGGGFHSPRGFVFKSQKGSVISVQHLNVLLKENAFPHLLATHCISTHSLRKTFGRRVYDNNNRSEDALNYLSKLFNHSSVAITRCYLGITKQELNNIYDNL